LKVVNRESEDIMKSFHRQALITLLLLAADIFKLFRFGVSFNNVVRSSNLS
jgi:hypothetical protein